MREHSDILNIIDQKADFSDEVAQTVIEDPPLISVVFEGLTSPTPRIKFRSAKILKIISAKEPELLYPQWDSFIDLLDNDNSIILWNVLDVIANLTAVDVERKFDVIFEKYYQFLEEGSMVTAAHVVDNSAQIAINRPDLQDKITKKLLQVYETPLGVECRDILSGKALMAFGNYFDAIKNREEVLSFAQKQLNSKRNATRVKAEKFLKKFDV